MPGFRFPILVFGKLNQEIFAIEMMKDPKALLPFHLPDHTHSQVYAYGYVIVHISYLHPFTHHHLRLHLYIYICTYTIIYHVHTSTLLTFMWTYIYTYTYTVRILYIYICMYMCVWLYTPYTRIYTDLYLHPVTRKPPGLSRRRWRAQLFSLKHHQFTIVVIGWQKEMDGWDG